MRVYVASSWRNERQPSVVADIRGQGHEVYDFRNPSEHALERDQGFHWSNIDPKWQEWSPDQYIDALKHPLAVDGFNSDATALGWADACVLVMPCGRSAHLELGWSVGAGKRTCILLTDGEPELMYAMVDRLCTTTAQVCAWLEEGP